MDVLSIKDEIKSLIIKEGFTMTDIAEKLFKGKQSNKYKLQNFSNKLRRGNIKYAEVLKIAKILGYEIKWVKKDKK